MRRLSSVLWVGVFSAWLGCARPAATPTSAPLPAPELSDEQAAPACLADDLGELRFAGTPDLSCLRTGECSRRCEEDDPQACMVVALELEHTGRFSRDAYARACRLGMALGCTNVGAGWLRSHSAAPRRSVRSPVVRARL
jgi:hypothetical protein